jgi:hypothetical protein
MVLRLKHTSLCCAKWYCTVAFKVLLQLLRIERTHAQPA